MPCKADDGSGGNYLILSLPLYQCTADRALTNQVHHLIKMIAFHLTNDLYGIEWRFYREDLECHGIFFFVCGGGDY
jgi:hypothetical protein